MQRKWTILSIILISVLVMTACGDDTQDSADTEEEIENTTQEIETQETESEEKEEENLSEEEEIATSTSEESTLNIEDYPEIPSTFEESTEYPIVGEFAGGEKYTREFSGQEEIIEVLNQFPYVSEESTEEEKERAMRYLFSLFKEDLTKVDVPIDQWESMQFHDPNSDSESETIRLKENYNVAILLDSSGSMGNYEDNKTRMQLAKESINQFVESLPEQANISLRVYGHVGTGSDADKEKSCSNIEEVYPLGKYDSGKFSEALNQFDPAGWTPMAGAIEQVEKDFKEYDGKNNTNIVYIVSDGIETCDGDPVETITSLSDSNVDPVINIIGYQVDNEGLKQLKEMAEASDGRYIHANSQADLTAEFEKSVDMAEIWSEWSRNAKDTVNDLHKTIRDQLNDWHNDQEDRMNREFNNLESAVYYLHDNELIDTDVYLDYIDIYRDYYLEIIDQARDQYLELHDVNTDEFFEKYDEVQERYNKAVE